MHGRQMKVRARSVLSHTLQRFGAQRFLWQASSAPQKDDALLSLACSSKRLATAWPDNTRSKQHPESLYPPWAAPADLLMCWTA